MEEMIREIIDAGLLRYAIDLKLQEDPVYMKDMEDAEQLDSYMKKLISEEQEMVLDDYQAVMQSANSRAQEIAYVLGVRNAVEYLQQLGALKVV